MNPTHRRAPRVKVALAEAGSPDREVQAGDRILFGKYSGNDVRIEDDKHLTNY